MNHRLPMDISAISTPKFNPVILMGNEGRERRQEMETGIPILIHLFRFLKKWGKIEMEKFLAIRTKNYFDQHEK